MTWQFTCCSDSEKRRQVAVPTPRLPCPRRIVTAVHYSNARFVWPRVLNKGIQAENSVSTTPESDICRIMFGQQNKSAFGTSSFGGGTTFGGTPFGGGSKLSQPIWPASHKVSNTKTFASLLSCEKVDNIFFAKTGTSGGGFGGFGAQTPASGSLFGGTSTTNTAGAGGLFGTNTSTTGFSGTSQTTGAFSKYLASLWFKFCCSWCSLSFVFRTWCVAHFQILEDSNNKAQLEDCLEEIRQQLTRAVSSAHQHQTLRLVQKHLPVRTAVVLLSQKKTGRKKVSFVVDVWAKISRFFRWFRDVYAIHWAVRWYNHWWFHFVWWWSGKNSGNRAVWWSL